MSQFKILFIYLQPLYQIKIMQPIFMTSSPNSKKYVAIIMICLGIAAHLPAQQLPLFTQYREAIGIINPAALNGDFLISHGDLSTFIGLSARTQWVGRKGTPKTQFIRGEMVTDWQNITWLLGGYIINDQVDRIGTTGIYGRAAVMITGNHPEEGGLSVGLAAGYVNYRVRLEGAIVRDPDDELALINQSRSSPDLGAGIYAWKALGNSYMYGGLSIPQILGLNVDFRRDSDTFNIVRVRHYYANAGMIVMMNVGEVIYIEPFIWAKYVPHTPFHVNAGFRYHFISNAWVGAGYGSNGSTHVEIGLELGDYPQYKIGYAFDGNFSGNVSYFGNSHEINLSVALPGK